MTQWYGVIEAWYEADDEEDAFAILNRLVKRVLDHPAVDGAQASKKGADKAA